MGTLSAQRIIDVLDRGARAWSDRGSAARRDAARAVGGRTGYSDPVVDHALDTLFGTIRADELRATIASELGSVAALDRFIARSGRPDVRYVPFGRVAIVASDTTIGVAIAPLCFALCAGAHVSVKDRADELVRAYVETLAEIEPELGARVHTASWSSENDARSGAHVRDAAVVVAFGGDAALAAIRRTLAPGARFVAYGHATSVGYVGREALASAPAAREIADAIVRDALLYDGDGCLSLHAVFVEGGGAIAPAAFARIVIAAADDFSLAFPAGTMRSAAVASYRSSARFRAAQHVGELFESAVGPHLVAYDPPKSEPPPLLPNVLALVPVDAPAEAGAYLAHHALPLEGFALAAAGRADIDELALASGASRIATFGALQRPPLGGDHGGGSRILPFVRAVYRG